MAKTAFKAVPDLSRPTGASDGWKHTITEPDLSVHRHVIGFNSPLVSWAPPRGQLHVHAGPACTGGLRLLGGARLGQLVGPIGPQEELGHVTA
ncbi:hypothetical protein CRG98_007023 [Punica granatum]|uniref:Uncharacterized protein n=1 Tax=Punica granatum TaxID=22663 RepID=A0A2I0KXU2_PUNGR|nr:hypothetical protein CRG98_007023 [Punica granatum]